LKRHSGFASLHKNLREESKESKKKLRRERKTETMINIQIMKEKKKETMTGQNRRMETLTRKRAGSLACGFSTCSLL
jgi:hypothetical protein